MCVFTMKFNVFFCFGLVCVFSQQFSLARTLSLDCLQPAANDCSFYAECIEQKFSCGDAGYALSYGSYFCQKFNNFRGFTENGSRWVTSTMLCLQERLVPFMENAYQSAPESCEVIEKWGFDTHAACYTQHEDSFCFLGPKDLIAAARVVGPGALIGEKKARQQLRQVLGICLKMLTSRKKLKSHRLLIEDLYRRY
jgi:hypothetical protein